MSQVWDLNIPTSEKFVLIALADFCDDAGKCWPSVSRIAEKCGMKERGVRGILRRLEDAGYLETNVGGGRHGCSQYTVKPGTTCPPAPNAPRHETTETRHETTQNPAPHAPEPSRTIKEPSIDDFEVFWTACPRRVGKGAARKAYASALKKADAATLLSGIKRHAVEMRGREQRFIPNPATWLNQERWLDGLAEEKPKADPTEIRVKAIKSGKRFLCTQISGAQARELVERNLVTTEECRLVGVL